MSNNPEIVKENIESTAEIQHAATERSVELAKTAENRPEQSPDARAEEVEQARLEANKEALMSKERGGGGEKKRDDESTAGAVRRVTKKQKAVEYKKTLSEVQSHMSTPARTFSKVIHNLAIEKTSELVGNTVARPNAVLAGSATAFIVTILVYLVAKHYGYTLSGFESIGAFIVGWLLGICFDYIRILVRGRTN